MFKEIPENTNLVINDTDIPDALIRDVFADFKTAKTGFEIVSAVRLSESLSVSLSSLAAAQSSRRPVILYPGQGAKIVRKFLSSETKRRLESFPGYDVLTSRTFSKNAPSSVSLSLPANLSEQISSGQIDTVVILDDVVATGQTVNTLVSALKDAGTTWDYSAYDQGLRFNFPKASVRQIEFIVACWLMQQSAKPLVPVSAELTYARKSSKVAVNSLSTWIGNSPKSQIVKQSYAEKYFKDPDELLALINYLITLNPYA